LPFVKNKVKKQIRTGGNLLIWKSLCTLKFLLEMSRWNIEVLDFVAKNRGKTCHDDIINNVGYVPHDALSEFLRKCEIHKLIWREHENPTLIYVCKQTKWKIILLNWVKRHISINLRRVK
jgi:hypothetical protein